MKTPALFRMMAGLMALLGWTAAGQTVYHVSTAQALQNALTSAASDGANNIIYIASGYYTGNFNYNSSNSNSLTILPEAGLSNTQITIDGAGTGRSMNVSCAADASITVQGITFLRNCGNGGIAALQIAGGGGSTILVNGCQLLSPSNSKGRGLELDSGLNATVTNCTANDGNGAGITIVGVTGNVSVQNCTVMGNVASEDAFTGGIEVYPAGLYVTDAGVVSVNSNSFSGNSQGYGAFSGADCSGTTVMLTGNVFTGNSSYDAGGAGCYGTTVTLNNNTFIGNYGGGAYCSGTTVTLSGNSFTGNSSGGSVFGGAGCYGATVTLNNNTFTSNSGLGADCGNNGYQTVILNNNTFTGNSGGGAYCYGNAVTLTNNAFTGNSGGGGAYCSGGNGLTISLSANTFTGNSSVGTGGGTYCSGNGSLTLSANTFNQNSAPTGGGIYVSAPYVNLLDNLVVKNSQTSSSSQGGGVWVDASATLNMINNTVFGNTAAGSGGGSAFEVTGTVELLNVYNNIIWGNSAGGNGGDVWLAGTGQRKLFEFNDVDSMYGIWDLVTNDIDLSPQFFDPVNGDYHTQSTSPCIAEGTTNAPALPDMDLDGNPRINNGLVDMGCYEFTTNVFHPADLTGSWVITPSEFTAYAAAWKSGQSWSNAPNPVPANYMTRAGYLMTNGGVYYNDGSARPVNWKIVP